MDTWALQKLALKCSHLIETFRGVWSADNFPLMKEDDASPSFQIVNTEASNKPGKHWILLCKRTKSGIGAIIFWDSLGKRPRKYKVLFERLNEIYKKIDVFNHPLQSNYSNCCGLYCILVAHYLPLSENNKAAAQMLPKKMVDECSLIRFINYHYNTAFTFVVI